jgi:hypothetical protein
MGRPQIYCSDSPNPAAAQRQAELEIDKAAFFALGGEVSQIPEGMTMATAPRQNQTVSLKQRIKDEVGE